MKRSVDPYSVHILHKFYSFNLKVAYVYFGTSRVTAKLRYYPKEYIQQFMAEAMSFVLRNAPDEHLKRGIDLYIFSFAGQLALNCLVLIAAVN